MLFRPRAWFHVTVSSGGRGNTTLGGSGVLFEFPRTSRVPWGGHRVLRDISPPLPRRGAKGKTLMDGRAAPVTRWTASRPFTVAGLFAAGSTGALQVLVWQHQVTRPAVSGLSLPLVQARCLPGTPPGNESGRSLSTAPASLRAGYAGSPRPGTYACVATQPKFKLRHSPLACRVSPGVRWERIWIKMDCYRVYPAPLHQSCRKPPSGGGGGLWDR